MPDFPENEVEILPDFLNDNLNGLWEPMQTAVSDADISVTGQITGPNAGLVNQMRSARRRLAQFLNHKDTLKVLEDLGRQFKHREFGQITGVPEFASVPRVSAFGEAFRTTPVSFRELFGTPGGPQFSVPRTLPGYEGPIPTPEQRTQILAWGSFLAEETEQRFRLGLLRAEVNVGLGKFDGDDGAVGR